MMQTSNTHRFRIPVHCGGAVYEDNGVLMLPDSYTSDGKPTTLVINCHGAGGTVATDDSQVEGQVITRYLLANGYAVMDVNGLPEDYAAQAGIDIRNNIGSPIAMESYIGAYHYCMEHFHLRREVFVHGGSMGGISSTNLVLSGQIPVIAQTGFCPVLDTYHQIFLHPWSGGLPRTALGILYGLARDGDGAWIYDAEKIAGYNPMERCCGAAGEELLSYPVPVKFWQCEDDDTVDISVTKRFVAAVCRAGGPAALDTFPDGGHEPQDRGAPVEHPAGCVSFRGETLAPRAAVEGAFRWIHMFDTSRQ